MVNKNAKELTTDFADQIDNFLNDNNLGLNIDISEKVISGVEEIINMQPDELLDLDKEDRQNISLLINQYCLYLSSTKSRLKNIIRYTNYCINQQLGKVWNDPILEYIPKDTKEHSAYLLKENKFLDDMMKIRLYSESRLEGLQEKIEILKNIGYKL